MSIENQFASVVGSIGKWQDATDGRNKMIENSHIPTPVLTKLGPMERRGENYRNTSYVIKWIIFAMVYLGINNHSATLQNKNIQGLIRPRTDVRLDRTFVDCFCFVPSPYNIFLKYSYKINGPGRVALAKPWIIFSQL